MSSGCAQSSLDIRGPAVSAGLGRGGLSTGTCATAATQAALDYMLSGVIPREVSVCLPEGGLVRLPVECCVREGDAFEGVVIKDAGDDPDVTHGAEVRSRVRRRNDDEIVFVRGRGVGVVTLPGLPVPVGEPAINPVPRDMMRKAVARALACEPGPRGVDIEVSLERGEELALRTLNPRLGIVGGVSILGTTGRVRPFSSEAYLATIRSALEVAVATGCRHLVLNSGGRTESLLRAQLPKLPEQAFVQYGNWIGEAFGMIAATPLRRVILGIMLGKAVKLAAGQLDTHSRVALWDRNFVAMLAHKTGAEPQTIARIHELTLARQLTQLFPFDSGHPFYRLLCEHCLRRCRALVPGLELELRLHNDGEGWIIQS